MGDVGRVLSQVRLMELCFMLQLQNNNFSFRPKHVHGCFEYANNLYL